MREIRPFLWPRQARSFVRQTSYRRSYAPQRLSCVHPYHNSTSFARSCHPASINALAKRRIEYNHIEGAEMFESYKPGGLHPIKIGDHLNGQYRVIHKLGFGTYSTTWLARDDRQRCLVAIKTGRADSTSRELDILRLLNATQSVTRNKLDRKPDTAKLPVGETLTAPLLDVFTISGPNGTHPCYVTAPASSSLAWAKGGAVGGLFKFEVARVIAAQLTLAVATVHSYGLVHGDLHLGNVLLRLQQDLNTFSDEQLYEKYNAPAYEEVSRVDGKPLPPGVPTHAVSTIWLGKPSERIALADSHILLTDFGEAFSPSQEKRYESHAPIVVRPPEARFEPAEPLSYPSDIWTLACSIWAILAWRSPFENFFGTEDDTTCEQVDALGPLPPAWWQKWEARRDYFTDSHAPSDGRAVRTLEDRFETSVQQYRRDAGMTTVSDEERDAVLSMLRPMFSYKPEDRPTIQQVLQSGWMQTWALPELQRLT